MWSDNLLEQMFSGSERPYSELLIQCFRFNNSHQATLRRDYPLRAIRTMVDEGLRWLSPEFSRMCAHEPSIAMERLLRSLMVQMLYRSGASGC
jgi:hypothetical protein